VITFDQAVNWLDWETPTKLYRRNQSFVQEIQTALPSRADHLYRYFLDYLSSNETPVDGPEIHIFCAIFLFQRDRSREAIDHLNQAIEKMQNAGGGDNEKKSGEIDSVEID